MNSKPNRTPYLPLWWNKISHSTHISSAPRNTTESTRRTDWERSEAVTGTKFEDAYYDHEFEVLKSRFLSQED